MALRGKALGRLCQSLWRLNISSSGKCDRGVQVCGLVPCRHVHQRSLPSGCPLPLSSLPPPSPPECLTGSSDNGRVVHDRTLQNESQVADENKGRGETNHIVNFVTRVGGLSSPACDKPLEVSVGWNLASWPHEEHLEYVCPSEKLTTLPRLVILENVPDPTTFDLPPTPNVSLIIDPAPPTTSAEISDPTSEANAPKEARQIMKIRRKKMKRHLLKKFRKRMAFTLRKIKRQKRKKKEAAFQARLAGIKEWGDSFNAKEWVQEELEKARKGGFYINVLEKRQ